MFSMAKREEPDLVMAKNTTAEIVVVAAAAAVIFWLWHANRAQGAGTGLDVLPVFSGAPAGPGLTAPVLPGAAPLFNLAPPVPGNLFSYQASPYNLPGPVSYGDGTGTNGSCDCSAGLSRAATFGSPNDLSSWLAGSSLPDQALAGVKNWY